jgi:gamma-glutamyltranspeptidase/glutathione hydrolase
MNLADKNSIFKEWKVALLMFIFIFASTSVSPGRTEKPVLHGRHWVAITGKPLAAMLPVPCLARLAPCMMF